MALKASPYKPWLDQKNRSSMLPSQGLELGIPPGQTPLPKNVPRLPQHRVPDEVSPESTSPWEVTIRRELTRRGYETPRYMDTRSSSAPPSLPRLPETERNMSKIQQLTGSDLAADYIRSLPPRNISPTPSDSSSVYSQHDKKHESNWSWGSSERSSLSNIQDVLSAGPEPPISALRPPNHEIERQRSKRHSFSRQREENLKKLQAKTKSITSNAEGQEILQREILAIERERQRYDMRRGRNHNSQLSNGDRTSEPVATKPIALRPKRAGAEYQRISSGWVTTLARSTSSPNSPVGSMESDFITLPPLPGPPSTSLPLRRFASDPYAVPAFKTVRTLGSASPLRIHTQPSATSSMLEQKMSKRKLLSDKMKLLSGRQPSKETNVLSTRSRSASGPDTPMPYAIRFVTSSGEHIQEVIAKAKQKVHALSSEERKKEKLKKSIVVLGAEGQSPAGNVSAWV